MIKFKGKIIKPEYKIPTLFSGFVIGVLTVLIGLLLIFSLNTIQILFGVVIGLAVALFTIYVFRKIKSERTEIQFERTWENDVGRKITEYFGLNATEEQINKLGARSISRVKTLAAGFSLFGAIALAISIGSLNATMLQVQMASEQNNLFCEQNRATDLISWTSETNTYTSAFSSFSTLQNTIELLFDAAPICKTPEQITRDHRCLINQGQLSSFNNIYISAMSIVAPYTEWENPKESMLDYVETQALFEEIMYNSEFVHSPEDSQNFDESYKKYITTISRLMQQARIRKEYLLSLIENQQVKKPKRQCDA